MAKSGFKTRLPNGPNSLLLLLAKSAERRCAPLPETQQMQASKLRILSSYPLVVSSFLYTYLPSFLPTFFWFVFFFIFSVKLSRRRGPLSPPPTIRFSGVVLKLEP